MIALISIAGFLLLLIISVIGFGVMVLNSHLDDRRF